MKSVFILTDIEGVAGVVSFDDQAAKTGRYYDDAKRLLTAEINAAVEGLLEVGVEDILVCDGHGAGGVWYDTLHPKARLLHGRPLTLDQLLGPVEGYDAAVIVGQHAMAEVPDSNMSHTFDSTSIAWKKINGEPFGEIAAFAFYAGTFGIPVIALAGERAACREIEALIPDVTTVSVKEGLGRNCAISLAPAESHARIKAGMIQAVKKHTANPIAPVKRDGPFEVVTKFYTTDQADSRASQPGYERIDDLTVMFKTDDLRRAGYR